MNKDKAVSDEEIIFPESELTINNEVITVAEINYMQGMKLHASIQPMLDDMAEAFTSDDADFSIMSGVFAKHQEIVNDIMLLTTGKDESWLHGLSDEDGQSLLMTFWMVNSHFFTRRLVAKSMHLMQAKAQAQAQAPASDSTMGSSSLN